MNNKLKTFTIRRETVVYHETVIKALNEADVWKRMDKHELEDEKSYKWKSSQDESGASCSRTYEIVKA